MNLEVKYSNIGIYISDVKENYLKQKEKKEDIHNIVIIRIKFVF